MQARKLGALSAGRRCAGIRASVPVLSVLPPRVATTTIPIDYLDRGDVKVDVTKGTAGATGCDLLSEVETQIGTRAKVLPPAQSEQVGSRLKTGGIAVYSISLGVLQSV